MRQCSCRIVFCRRSTKPLVHAWRGFVRVTRMREPLTARGEGALEFLAVVGEHALQRASRPGDRSGRTTSRRKASTAAAVTSPTIRRAHANDDADITAGDLPHLAHAFQLADVERIERQQVARAAPPRHGATGFAVRSVSSPVVAALHCSSTARRARRVPSCCRRNKRQIVTGAIVTPSRASWSLYHCGPHVGHANAKAITRRSVCTGTAGGRPRRAWRRFGCTPSGPYCSKPLAQPIEHASATSHGAGTLH